MKNTIALAIFMLLAVFGARAQNIVTDLYGFQLGQFRETATNEFGAPLLQDSFPDGFQYEFFLLKPDTSLYMLFEYAAGRTGVIWSIQISGSDAGADLGFKNLRLGMSKKQVEKTLGKPAQKINVDPYGERWEYSRANYSVEISPEGQLSSIKIKDTYSRADPDLGKLPNFKAVAARLTAKENSDIAAILAPGLEIYYQGKAIFFEKSIRTEIATDHSKVFETIRFLSQGLGKIDTSNPEVYEENARMSWGNGAGPLHVIKIKSGHPIKEIVFQYLNEQFLIWEIKAR